MARFYCTRDAIDCGGHQEFMVEAETLEEARELFKSGKGEFVADETEIINLGEYDLDAVWED